METFYKAYTKVVDEKSYYFVKKYLRFPEYQDLGHVQYGYGMHTDFNKACEIAGLSDKHIRKQLIAEIEGAIPTAKVIELLPVENNLLKKVN